MGADYNDVVNRIKEERVRLGLSQREMACFARINQSNVNRVEQGTRRFSYSELKYLCDSPIDVHYMFMGNKCGETYKEYFAHYDYGELVNIMHILSSAGMLARGVDVAECWRNIYANAALLWHKEKKKAEANIFLLIRQLKDYRQLQMAKIIGVDVKKLRDLENDRNLPDSELIWKMYQLFGVSPAFILRDKSCLINEVCFALEAMDEELRIKVLSIIEAVYAK